jgi:PAS domain S-box-containing protein
MRLRFAAIVESSDDAIIAKTLDGEISAWNVAAERMFGYPEHEAIGQPITLIVPPAALRQSEQRLAREVACAKTLQSISTRLVSESTPSL